MVIDMIETYYMAGAPDKAIALAKDFVDELFVSMNFFLEYYDIAKKEFESCYNCVSYLADVTDHFGDKDFADQISKRFNDMVGVEE